MATYQQTVSPQEWIWVEQVSSRTGVDPRVLVAWANAEGNPGGSPGYNNWLNISTGAVPGLGVQAEPGSYGTARFSSVSTGVTATVNEINRVFGQGGLRGLPPSQAISKIANSGWASGKYRGTDGVIGSSLVGSFNSTWGGSFPQDKYFPPQNAGSLLTALKIGASQSKGGISIGSVPGPAQGVAGGIQSGVGAANAAGSAITSVASFLAKLGSVQFLLRAGEVLGGAALVGMGAFLLAKQIGLSAPPVPSVIVTGANRAAGEREAQNREAGNRERAEDRRAEADMRRVERSQRLSEQRAYERDRVQSEEIPF